MGDDVGHGERLARSGDSQQGLVPVPGLQRLHQSGDRLRLVTGGLVVGMELEEGHGTEKCRKGQEE